MGDPKVTTISRKTLLHKWFQAALRLLGLGAVACLYSYGWERKWIEVTQVPIEVPSLPETFKGMKLVHFSDLHLGHYCEPEDVRHVVELIMQERPDMICFTGDLVDESTRYLSAVVPILRQLRAPFGKYAVLGNHDYRMREQHVVRDALSSSGFEVLDNRHIRVEKQGSALCVAGVDDVLFGVPDLTRAVAEIPAGDTVILLAHEPDFAQEAAAFPIHLQLSGHSHGGQVRLPLIGPILTPKLSQKYVQGLYRVEKKDMQVYTTRGIGTTILPIRFLCRPEVTVLTLR
ncbi:metallophosphoesterase [Brevibacillus choshinensis]|uniref:Metallophosphoesterase n=1 Tax=Brevibacillus choshinensis TaxID=54911 RepID=A0ABX7FU86_BRECH|nr:metallophosphoesterase [Brevibacillus choshinensis]QRG69811.1 metallophosphoesterase [Brevibacillus choshinensis]